MGNIPGEGTSSNQSRDFKIRERISGFQNFYLLVFIFYLPYFFLKLNTLIVPFE
jgi:hypothetical protein